MIPDRPQLFHLDAALVLPLVPSEMRSAVGALATLDRALASARLGCREPTLRAIRLRWWADQIEQIEHGDTPPDPALRGFAEEIAPHLSAELRGRMVEWALSHDDPVARGEGVFAIASMLLGAPSSAGAGALWGEVADAIERREPPPRSAALAPAERSRALPRPLRVMAVQAADLAARRGRVAPLRDQWLSLRVGLFGR